MEDIFKNMCDMQWFADAGCSLEHLIDVHLPKKNDGNAMSKECDGRFSVLVPCLEEADNAEKLIKSLIEKNESFVGEILVLTNKQQIREELCGTEEKYASYVRVFCNEQVHSYAQAQNALSKLAIYDWLVLLDERIFFTGELFSGVCDAVKKNGCDCLSLAYDGYKYDLNGRCAGQLIPCVHDEYAGFAMGELAWLAEDKNYLRCTGIKTEACIVSREVFLSMEGFRENIHSSLNNAAFSYDVYRIGGKAGFLHCGSLVLNEKRQEPEIDDEEYKCKAALEDGTYIISSYHALWRMRGRRIIQSRKKKIRIALILDRPNWAFAHIAEQIIRYDSDIFEFKRLYACDTPSVVDLLIQAEDCEIIHMFWRGNYYALSSAGELAHIAELGMDIRTFLDKYVRGKIFTTEVYDHLYLKDDERKVTRSIFDSNNSLVDGYAVSSQKLMGVYLDSNDIEMKPICILPDGVDCGKFFPMNRERFSNIKDRTVCFGWVGNSKWSEKDLKGINTIIRPAIKQLQSEGYNVELYASDRDNGMIPHDQMPEYYSKIDCYICASSSEGTPNPALESMACGVPVISTDVGLIPQLFGEKQKHFVLEERTIECLKQKIKELLRHPELFKELSEENLKSIRNWDWSICARRFVPFWMECLGRKY